MNMKFSELIEARRSVRKYANQLFAGAGIAQESPFPFGAADIVAEDQQVIVLFLRITGGQVYQGRLHNVRPSP